MDVSGVNPGGGSSPIIPVEGKWQVLMAEWEKINALLGDMKNNPQNALKDISQILKIAKEMKKISEGMKTPPSSPNFHKDFENLVIFAKDLKTAIEQHDTTAIATFQKDVLAEMANIRRDLMH